jgi:Family of unknown function (DUF5946)
MPTRRMPPGATWLSMRIACSVERYGHSAKSYAAHLPRLCCGLEHDGDPQEYGAVQRWLNGTVAIERLVAPSRRGQMTVADLRAARSAQEHSRLVREWAANVWRAYSTQHNVARQWIRAVLNVQAMAKTKRISH